MCVYSTSDAIVQKYSVSDTHHRHFNFNVIVLIVFDLFYVFVSSRFSRLLASVIVMLQCDVIYELMFIAYSIAANISNGARKTFSCVA